MFCANPPNGTKAKYPWEYSPRLVAPVSRPPWPTWKSGASAPRQESLGKGTTSVVAMIGWENDRLEKTGASAPEGSQSRQAEIDGPSPWSKRRDQSAHRENLTPLHGPISLDELHAIAEESSQAERRAAEAERELMEWKKVKFMQDRVGEDFDGLITSVTKFGFFVELTDLFVEGLVPMNSLTDDYYTFHEGTRELIGQRSRKTYRLGQRIRVLVDRIDPVEKKIQFAIFEEASPTPPRKPATRKSKKEKRKR